MSKRYVIQVATVNTPGFEPEWETMQHPSGGDWLTHSRKTALCDAARLVNEGETRELRIAISQPIYSLTLDVEHGAIAEYAAQLKTAAPTGFYGLRASADAGETWEMVQHDDGTAWWCRSYGTAFAKAEELLADAPAEARVQLVRKDGEFDVIWDRDSFADDDEDENEDDESPEDGI
jgi:hypothetical protein